MAEQSEPWCGVFFYVAAGGAAITAFYMFRLWYMTFAGKPRDHHVYEHAHESPRVMYVPLVVLAVLAIVVGWPLRGGVHESAGASPAGGHCWRPSLAGVYATSRGLSERAPEPRRGRAQRGHAGRPAATALAGLLLGHGDLWLAAAGPGRNRATSSGSSIGCFGTSGISTSCTTPCSCEPVLFISRRVADFDRQVIDRFIDGWPTPCAALSVLDDMIDRYLSMGW